MTEILGRVRRRMYLYSSNFARFEDIHRQGNGMEDALAKA
ncbi:hypothetical protein Golax_012125, partial [Gossypium laxum]|nr:hypothetical protein [Gossypium laxum]